MASINKAFEEQHCPVKTKHQSKSDPRASELNSSYFKADIVVR